MTSASNFLHGRVRGIIAALIVPIAIIAVPGARAATNNWISSGDQDWFQPGNWSAGVPSAADDAFIKNDTTASVRGATAATAGNLFIDSGTVRVGGSVAGTLTVDGQIALGATGSSGRLDLSYGTVSVNTLAVESSGTYSDTYSGTLNLTGTNPTIRMADGVNVVVNSRITGVNGLNKEGPGTLTLTTNNTYTGGTRIGHGILQIGNGGSSGSLGGGDVVNDGTLVFNRNDETVVDNLITGGGNLKQAGSGKVTLTADNTYTGVTTVSAGTLQIGDGGTSGSLGTGTVSNNATLVFNRSDNIVVGNQLRGTGNLMQIGDGTLTLTANNTYSGTTTISNGVLQVGNGGTSGTLGTGTVMNNGALRFNRSDNITVNNLISGTGSLTQDGTNTLTLTGNNTYSGTTSIATNGTLQIGNGGTSGSLGTGAVTNNGALRFNRSDNVTVNNLITGAGTLEQTGTNAVTLTGNNTYAGTTSIATNGTLQIGSGGTSGTLGSGNVINDGLLAFNRSDSVVTSNTISGSGSVRQSGSGTNTLIANNTYSGGTTIESGRLQIGDGGTTGSVGSGAVTNNGVLAYDRSDNVEVGNTISGIGRLVHDGSGTLTLTASNTYSGATSIGTNGTLQIGNGGMAGSLGTGNVTNYGVLVFNRGDDTTVSNSVSGSGRLVQSGAGTLTLTGNNTYSGITTISNGVLQVGDGGGTGSLGTNEVQNDGALVFNRTNSLVFGGVISGTGSLVAFGGSNSTVTLTATNTYSGGTFVENGSTLVVQNNHALGDGDVTLLDGTLKAGATGPTNKTMISVGGNYKQSTNSTLILAIGGDVSNESTNEYDQLDVAGTAELGGTLRVEGANGYEPHHDHTQVLVSSAGGLTNEFSTFTNTISHSDLLSPRLSYSTTNVTLNWDHMSFVEYLTVSNDVKLTGNQLAVGRGLDSITNSTATNDVKLLAHLDYLSNLTNELPAAFDQIAPEELTAMVVASFAVMDAQGEQFLNRARELRANYRQLYTAELGSRVPLGSQLRPDFDSMVTKSWDLYVELPVHFISVKADENAGGYDITGAGVSLGADRFVKENLVVGATAAYANSSADLTGRGDVELEAIGGQVYASWLRRALHLEAMLGGGFNSYKTKREALDGVATGSADGFGWTALVGGGYDWVNGPWKLGPQLALQYESASISEFTEEGSMAPLRIVSQTEDTLHSQVGLSIRYRHLVGESWTIFTPEVYFAWRHDFMGNSVTLDSEFASGAGDVFTVKGPKLGSDSILASAGITAQWKPSFNTYVNLTAQLGRSGYDSQSLNFGMRLSF